MTTSADLRYLYLTTTGRRTGQPHTIEIWYVEHDERAYLMADGRERADWVRNILADPAVSWRYGARDAPAKHGSARTVDPAHEPALAEVISARMQDKYGWNKGLIVELAPA